MAEIQEVKISFGQGDIGEEQVIPLGNNQYRLATTPLASWFLDLDLAFGDVIEAEPGEDGTLHFRRVVSPSTWRHLQWSLSKDFTESDRFHAWKQVIEEHEGAWEQVFQGIFIVHLPETSSFDPEAALADLERMGDEEVKKLARRGSRQTTDSSVTWTIDLSSMN